MKIAEIKKALTVAEEIETVFGAQDWECTSDDTFTLRPSYLTCGLEFDCEFVEGSGKIEILKNGKIIISNLYCGAKFEPFTMDDSDELELAMSQDLVYYMDELEENLGKRILKDMYSKIDENFLQDLQLYLED